jgi:hypothetical protein
VTALARPPFTQVSYQTDLILQVGDGKVLPPDKNTLVFFDMVNPPLEYNPKALAVSATCPNCVCLGPGGSCDSAASWNFPQLVRGDSFKP